MSNLKLNERQWYWMHSGYAGNNSILVSPYKKTGRVDGGYFNLSSTVTGGRLVPMPETDEWMAIGLDGRQVTISANQLDTAGSIGIGTIEFRPDAKIYLYREDAARMLKAGYTEDEICTNFGTSWKDGEDGEDVTGDLTDKMLEMLMAVKTVKDTEEEEAKVEADRRYREQLAKCQEKYDYIPCKRGKGHDWLTAGETSRNLRAILKHEFPNIRFSVKSHSYSGGDSVRVEYTDGPAIGKVRAIVELFGTKTFDGMQDLEEDCSTAFNDVAGGFSYTHLYREISNEIREKVKGLFVENGFGKYGESDLARKVSGVCDKADFDGREIEGIRYIEKDGEGNYVGEWELVFKETVKPTGGDRAEQTKATTASVEVTENKEKNGIEIRFAEKPDKAVLDDLKGHGWRWSRFAGCWYNRATDENREFAEGMVA